MKSWPNSLTVRFNELSAWGMQISHAENATYVPQGRLSPRGMVSHSPADVLPEIEKSPRRIAGYRHGLPQNGALEEPQPAARQEVA